MIDQDSILQSTKHSIGGLTMDDTNFDPTIITHINASFVTLWELGVGPSNGFAIEDGSALWSDFSVPVPILGMVKEYIYQRARLKFDPPTSTAHLQALKEGIAESEWRLREAVEIFEMEVTDG